MQLDKDRSVSSLHLISVSPLSKVAGALFAVSSGPATCEWAYRPLPILSPDPALLPPSSFFLGK